MLGRYIEPDPLGLSSGSLNNYVYVGNNPINYIDPMGQSFWHDVLTGGLIAGLAVPGADVADAGALAADLSAEAMTGDEAATVATESPEAVAEDTGATKSQICPEDVRIQKGLNDRPLQKHHFATNKSSKYTAAMGDIAEKYGLDLEGEWNTEQLPHIGRHPNEYHDFVLAQMEDADNIAQGHVGEFLRLFEENIKQPIRENPELLRKSGWR